MKGSPLIDCVTIENCQNFSDNPIVEQHKLRYREVIGKEKWTNVYVCGDMEFDQYDNLATEYYVARNKNGQVVGVTRSYPTTIPYMLSESFKYLFSGQLPSSPVILEASRLVLDRTLLNKEERKPVVEELIVAYMERGRQRGIDAYIGFMLPKIWESTFIRSGWDVQWLGPEVPLPQSNDIVRAGLMPVNEEMEEKVRMTTGLHTDVLNFGEQTTDYVPGMSYHSHKIIENNINIKKAA